MGLIKAAASAIGTGLADQWLEVFEANDMGGSTVFTSGVPVRKGKGSNTKGTSNIVSNGSVIHVYPNQFMMVVDGGKVVDYTAEEGYYTVQNSSAPSLFNGQFGDTLKETFNRIKYGGVPSSAQKVFFINTQEIKGNKFGTPNPVNYFDTFYNAELFLRAHGNYSIRIVNPLLFYSEVIPKNASKVEFDDIADQYLSEFLEAFQAAINNMSAEGERISFVTSKGKVLSDHMRTCLDAEWTQQRGFEVQNVGIASISYSEESQKLINMRNQGAMLSDPTIREGFVQGQIASGINAAGNNPNGAAGGMMGVGLGMAGGLGYMNMASQNNMAQMQYQQQMQQMQQQQQAQQPQMQAPSAAAAAGSWTCECGTVNKGKFCTECGKAQPAPKPAAGEWTCSCGTVNRGKFCTECGKAAPAPAPAEWTCSCGAVNKGKFCTECGKARP